MAWARNCHSWGRLGAAARRQGCTLPCLCLCRNSQHPPVQRPAGTGWISRTRPAATAGRCWRPAACWRRPRRCCTRRPALPFVGACTVLWGHAHARAPQSMMGLCAAACWQQAGDAGAAQVRLQRGRWEWAAGASAIRRALLPCLSAAPTTHRRDGQRGPRNAQEQRIQRAAGAACRCQQHVGQADAGGRQARGCEGQRLEGDGLGLPVGEQAWCFFLGGGGRAGCAGVHRLVWPCAVPACRGS